MRGIFASKIWGPCFQTSYMQWVSIGGTLQLLYSGSIILFFIVCSRTNAIPTC